MGCQTIAEKQAELEKNSSNPVGLKVALMPAAVQAALEAHREMTQPKRRRFEDD